MLGRKVIYVRCINCSYTNMAKDIRLLDKNKHILAHLSRRLIDELIVYQSLRRPSVVRQHFQTSSPQQPLAN